MAIDLSSKDYDPLSKEEEQNLFRSYFETKNQKIRESILRHNYRFVLFVVRKYVKNYDEIDDYFSEGCLGLVEAFDRFTLERDVKFISYAIFWIKRYIFDRYNADKNPDDISILSIDSANDDRPLDIEQVTYESQESEYRRQEVKRLLDGRLSELNSFEETLVRLHHINNIPYESIAKQYGIKREKVRLTTIRALSKIGNSVMGKYVLSKEI